jgi:hypothetical protein
MPEKEMLKNPRARLWILLVPGILMLLLPILAGPPQPINPGIGGLRWQSIAPIGALLLLAGGALLHRRAVSDSTAGSRSYWKTVLFTATAVIGGLATSLIIAELAARQYLSATSGQTVLIFPPYSKVSIQTPEYAYTATANSLGFRDEEPGPKSTFRILAVGDSFTYGWGVELSNSWPKVLERECLQHGRQLQVLDLGCPGASVDVYAEVAQRAIPLLKPDLVLVGVLQGDDLKQLDLGGTLNRLAGSRWALRTVMSRAWKSPPSPAERVTREWRHGAQMIQARLKPDESARLLKIDPHFRTLFFEGNLSPHLMFDSVKYPDYLKFTLDASRAEVQKATATMAQCLERIGRPASAQGARVMVLSVPWYYVSAPALASAKRLGFEVEGSMLGSNAPDETIRAAARAAGLDFYTFTEKFREECKQRDLFFEYDGHFNAAGQALYGEEVSKLLFEKQMLRTNAPITSP